MGNTFSCPPRERVFREPSTPRAKVGPVGGPVAKPEKFDSPATTGDEEEYEYFATSYRTFKKIWPVVVGSSMEWFEYSIFNFVIMDITDNFFPGSPSLAWLCSGVSLAVRPLGGVVFGWVGDKVGRKSACRTALFTLLVPTVGQAFLPTFVWGGPTLGHVGVVALIVFRVAQGIAIGGLSSINVWVSEVSDSRCLAMTSGMKDAVGSIAYAASCFMVFGINLLLTDQQMLTFGWRIPFLIGAVPAFIALDLINHVPESLELGVEAADSEPRSPVARPTMAEVSRHTTEVVRNFPEQFRAVLVNVIGSGSMGLLCGAFASQYLTYHAGIPKGSALAISTLYNVCCVPSALVSGYLGDHIGIGKTLIAGSALCAATCVPLTALVLSQPGNTLLAGAVFGVLFAVTSSLSGTVMGAFIAEAFEGKVRTSGSAAATNTAVCMMAGLPALASLCAESFSLAPAVIVCSANVMRLCVFVPAYRKCKRGELKLTHIRDEPY